LDARHEKSDKYGKEGKYIRSFGGETGRTKPATCRWKYSVQIEIEWENVDWINLVYNRKKWQAVVNTVMNILVVQNVENFFTS
jgi:hypothetical protein